MTAIVGMLMNSWWIARMKTCNVQGVIFEGNTGSIRVFEKNGFQLRKTVPDCMHVIAKGETAEELRTVHFMQWSNSHATG